GETLERLGPWSADRGDLLVQFEPGPPVLAAVAATDLAAEVFDEKLHSVADAENRFSCAGDPCRNSAGAFFTDRVRASGENHAVEGEIGGRLGSLAVDDLGIDAQFPKTPGDQEGVLGAVVENQKTFVDRSLHVMDVHRGLSLRSG